MEISITKTTTPKQKPADESKLGFGQYYTDHMFIMNYDEGEGWHNPRIVPYGPFELDPAAMVLHYAQEIFEGMKAYRTADGSIQLFRPDKNMARMNVSCDRLCIPKIDEEFAIKAIKTLVEVDKDWVPSLDGTSLYIRPYIFATDAQVGVHPAKHLTFAIILSPVGAYYPQGIAIEPSEGKVFAPVDGVVENIPKSKHAIAITADNDANILIHVGLDTVELDGNGFDVKVANGAKIKKGDLLMTFNLNGIKKQGYKMITPIVVCNADEFAEFKTVADGDVNVGDDVIRIVR